MCVNAFMGAVVASRHNQSTEICILFLLIEDEDNYDVTMSNDFVVPLKHANLSAHVRSSR